MKMNNIFFSSTPKVLNTELAILVGLQEAIVLQQLHYWHEINKRDNRNFHDESYCSYNNYRQWQADEFVFWSESQIKRIFQSLEKRGLIYVGNYNHEKIDRTKWYSVNYDKIAEIQTKKQEENLPI